MTQRQAQSLASNPKGSRRPGRPRDAGKDQLIADAMLKLLAEHGYEGASFEKVAVEAQVSRAAIYRRWPTKEHLVLYAVTDMLGQDSVSSAASDDGGIASVERLLMRTAKRLRDPFKLRVIAALVSEAAARPVLAKLVSELEHERRGPLQVALAQGQERGDVGQRADTAYLSDALIGALYFRALVAQTSIEDQDVSRLVAAILKP